VNKTVAIAVSIIVSLPAVAFWYLNYFVQWGSGSENFAPMMAWIFIAPVTFVFALVGLSLAVKYRRNALWWIGLLFEILPTVWMTVTFKGFSWLLFWYK
jgi:hypothetical protein